MRRASIRVDIGGENIAGVMLPVLNMKEFEDAGSLKKNLSVLKKKKLLFAVFR